MVNVNVKESKYQTMQADSNLQLMFMSNIFSFTNESVFSRRIPILLEDVLENEGGHLCCLKIVVMQNIKSVIIYALRLSLSNKKLSV